MAEKTNKSTTILLLVVAGALLFLVGSFTGQITWGRVNPKTTLTTNCKVISGGSSNYNNPNLAPNELCKTLGKYCIFAMQSDRIRLFDSKNSLCNGNLLSAYIENTKIIDCSEGSGYLYYNSGPCLSPPIDTGVKQHNGDAIKDREIEVVCC